VVTCYSNTGYTSNWTPSQSSHHEHHLKLCRNLSSRTITEPKPLSASHVARRTLGPNRLAGITHRQAPRTCRIITCTVNAWRTSPCRQAPLVAIAWRARLAPPGASLLPSPLLFDFAWRNRPYRQAPHVNSGHCHWFVFRPPGGSLLSPGAILVARCYWYLGT